MGLLLENGLVEAVCFLILIYWYLTKDYDYWKKRGVPYKKPQFPFGSIKEIMLARTFTGKGHDDIYKEFPNERFYGIIESRTPTLVLKDPELIKKVMVKDFQYFVDRPVIMGNPNEYIIKHLLTLKGKEWKDMRAKLTPTFTSGKLRLMFALMEKSSDILNKQLETEVNEGRNIIDVKNLLARFTMDIIASCAFGIDTDNLKEENSEFFKIFGGVVKSTKWRYIRRQALLQFPFLMQIFRLNLVKPKVRDFVTNLVRDTIQYRQKHGVHRNDFLDLLLSIKHNKNEETVNGNLNSNDNTSEGLTIEQMAPQTFVFLVAGFETASSLMAFCLYELSCHKDIQERLYQEIETAVKGNDGKFSYNVLTEIPFLDQVINETLRLYGSANVLTRVCTQAYKIPDSDLVVEKGLKVMIPLFSLHHDPQYYPDPYKFDPDRFTPEETKNRHPYVFMPFGEGPRNCIGMRFGLMEAKIGLATVILNFQVTLSPQQEVPIEIDRLSVPLMPANPVLLKFEKRKRENTS